MGLTRLQRSSSGLTLVESVISLGVMTIITLSLLSLFLSARTMGSKGEGVVTATNLAEAELDRWKTSDFLALEALIAQPETYRVEYLGQSYDIIASAARLSSNSTSAEYRVLKLTVLLEWQEKKQLTMAKVGQGTVNQTSTIMRLDTMVSAVGSL
jgi:Tfp pilus assembly protein PilX